MALPVGTVPTVRDMFPYGMSLCSYTCPHRKGQNFGPLEVYEYGAVLMLMLVLVLVLLLV